MKTLVVANQKGGAGKTTLTANLTYAALAAGLRVLVIDMDKQGSLSRLNFKPAADSTGVHVMFFNPGLYPAAAPALLPAGPLWADGQLGVVRASDELKSVQDFRNPLGLEMDADKYPAMWLKRWSPAFDLCLIDTPGELGTITQFALNMADAVVCPCEVGQYEAQALVDLWRELQKTKATQNKRLRLLGLLFSKIDAKRKGELLAMDEVRSKLGGVVLPMMLTNRAIVRASAGACVPVWHDARSGSHRAAAAEWRTACAHILGLLGGK